LAAGWSCRHSLRGAHSASIRFRLLRHLPHPRARLRGATGPPRACQRHRRRGPGADFSGPPRPWTLSARLRPRLTRALHQVVFMHRRNPPPAATGLGPQAICTVHPLTQIYAPAAVVLNAPTPDVVASSDQACQLRGTLWIGGGSGKR